VATKFPRITERYFSGKGVPVEIIRLSGSIELAPLVGLCERIVDVVETGRTLVENGLVEVEEIMPISARLIVNRASQKTKYEQVTDLIQRLKPVL
jgi:ATP phosphoribosyltransferase